MLKVDAQDKEKLIDPLFARPGKALILTVAGLLLVIGWGVFMYVRQLFFGLGETNMTRPAYWATYIVNFVFFIGISHAGTLISAILRVTGAEWRRPITRVAEAITVFALAIGMMQILIDLGRPDRLLFPILYGRLQSPIIWDFISVTVYFLGSVTYLFLPLMPDLAIIRDNMPATAMLWQQKLYTILSLGWRGTREQWMRLEKAIAAMAVFIIPVAVSVHSIISWILASTLQPGWHSTIFGPYFVVGAIFSGIGALFIAMTAVRKAYGLENYILQKQYRNLGLLFITMNAIWFYFTFAENLGIATGQQTYEFPVLAAKLWGDFALPFWLMIGIMAIAFWVLVVPLLIPKSAERVAIFRPRFSLGSAVGAALILVLIFFALPVMPIRAGLDMPTDETVLWILLILEIIGVLLGVTLWLKANPVAAKFIAAILVVIGMWLERWNIVVGTTTHAMLIPYISYLPSLTEIAVTAASVSLFALMFILFFRIFPSISIWEVAEGRLKQESHAAQTAPTTAPASEMR